MNDAVYGITLDIDWAPDFMIDAAARALEAAGVKATWFVTHECDAVARLRRRRDLFELGIHPNFHPGSTHGNSPAEVLATCFSLVPDATSVRCHGLMQSSRLLNLFIESTPLTADATLFLPAASGLQVTTYRCAAGAIRRVPFFWEDDVEFHAPEPHWHPEAHCQDAAGLQIFNFHPVHVYLNSSAPGPYAALCARCPDLRQAAPRQAADLVLEAPGAGSMFATTVARIAATGGGVTVRELAAA